jgi:very-short-patch-repair endonuclease
MARASVSKAKARHIADESEAIAQDRAVRRAWLEARGYRLCVLDAGDVEHDIAEQLDRISDVYTAAG